MRHVTEGEIGGLAHVHRQREANQTSPMRIEESVLYPEGHPTCLTGPTHQRSDIVRLGDQVATNRWGPARSRGRRTRRVITGRRIRIGIALDGLARTWSPTGREALHEAAKFHLGEEPVKPGTIGLPHLQRLQVQLDVEIRHERHELPGESDLVRILRERLPHTLGGDFARVLENLVEAPVLIEKLEGRFRPNAPGSGNVVRGVPDQGQVVDYLGRRNTEFLVSITLVYPFGRHTRASAAPGVQEVDTGSHELIEILVAGNDDGLDSCISRLDRESADYVIGLVTV